MDFNGCLFIFNYILLDLCDSYILNFIYFILLYKFVVMVFSLGCNMLQGIEWFYDNEVFEEVDCIDGLFFFVLELCLNFNVFNYFDMIQIFVWGINCQGC